MKYQYFIVALTISIVFASEAFAVDAPSPGHQRYIDVPRIQATVQSERDLPARLPGAPPVIDGALDDSVWQIASISGDFWVSVEDRPPADKTEVLVFRDDVNLYFGFRIYESNSEAIVATR